MYFVSVSHFSICHWIQCHQQGTSFSNPLLKNSSSCFRNSFSVAEWTSSSHTKWISLRCLLIAANNQESDGATCGLLWGCGTTLDFMLSVLLLKWQHTVGYGIVMLKKHRFSPEKWVCFIVLTQLGSSRKSGSLFSYLWLYIFLWMISV